MQRGVFGREMPDCMDQLTKKQMGRWFLDQRRIEMVDTEENFAVVLLFKIIVFLRNDVFPFNDINTRIQKIIDDDAFVITINQ